MMTDLQVYDTTLRDGAQQEGLSLSVADKLAIAVLLDELGVGFIEGGWPGANPKDTEFFARPSATSAAQRNAHRVWLHAACGHRGSRRPADPCARGLGCLSGDSGGQERMSVTSSSPCAQPFPRTSR
jgi:2-isopropylmalate synthase